MTSKTPVTFKITVQHEDGPDRHDWFFPNGWRGVGPIEKRDVRGQLQGKREGFYPDWFVLMCNWPNCPGRAVVPVRVLTDFADSQDPRGRRLV